MTARALLLLLALALVAASPRAAAQAVPLDDTGTLVMGRQVPMRWDDARGATQMLSGSVVVHLRLDVRAWRGQVVRIYQVLPAQPGTPVEMQWRSRGVLMPGRMRDGDRVLVFAGRIDADQLQDTLELGLRLDGDRSSERERLRVGYELETDPT